MFYTLLFLYLLTPAFGVRMQYDEKSGSELTNKGSLLQTDKLDFPCGKLNDVVFCDNPRPLVLASGSFSQGWLVKNNKTKKVEVMKLLLGPNKERFATIGDYRLNIGKTRLRVQEGRKECKILQSLHKMFPNSEGSKHVMSCTGIDYDFDPNERHDLDPSMPLYGLFSYSGGEELDDFMPGVVSGNRTSAVNVFRMVFKQVMQGLKLLSSVVPPIIHHDLKPANIIVKTTTGQDGIPHYSTQIIDFGAVVMGRATKEDLCNSSMATLFYAPSEYQQPSALCGPDVGKNFDVDHPKAFDIFSLAVSYVEVLTNQHPVFLFHMVMTEWCSWVQEKCGTEELDPNVTDVFRREFTNDKCKTELEFCKTGVVLEVSTRSINHKGLDHVVSQDFDIVLEFFKKVLKVYNEDYLPFTNKVLEQEESTSFLKEVFQALKYDPSERPTIDDLLSHPWMQNTQLDPFDVEREEVAEDVFKQVIKKRSQKAVEHAAAEQESVALAA